MSHKMSLQTLPVARISPDGCWVRAAVARAEVAVRRAEKFKTVQDFLLIYGKAGNFFVGASHRLLAIG